MQARYFITPNRLSVCTVSNQVLVENYLRAGYKEVIVTDKTEPKKYKEKVALFKSSYQPDGIVIYRVCEPGYEDRERITDWVEVEFTERQD